MCSATLRRMAVCGTSVFAAADMSSVCAARAVCEGRATSATCRVTSCAVTRPLRPVPLIAPGAMSCSCSSRLTEGLSNSESARLLAAERGVSIFAAAPGALVSAASVASPGNLNRASTSSGLTSALSSFRTSINVPLAGAGTSTVTLSVSSSTSGSSLTTKSPTALHHLRIVARVPSSFAGASTSLMPLISDFGEVDDRARDGLDAGQHGIEQYWIMRTRNIRHGQTLDGRVEIEESLFGEHRRDFRAESGGHRVLVNNEAAARLAYRCQRSLAIPRRQRA